MRALLAFLMSSLVGLVTSYGFGVVGLVTSSGFGVVGLVTSSGFGAAPASAVELPKPAVLGSLGTRFDPVNDVFPFANDLVWDYEGALPSDQPKLPPGERFTQHCSQMARAVRQYFHTARFDPDLPPPSPELAMELVARVMATDPRRTTPLEPPIEIPGFRDLRSFSEAYEGIVKDAVGRRLESYLQRGNWRMIFPFSPDHQQRTADALLAELAADHPPLVHVMHFPRVTVNHTILVYRAETTATEVHFLAYDPNTPGRELRLRFVRADAHFELEPTNYWKGGPVKAYEVFHGWAF